MSSSWMIYGANGYTGKLITEEAVKRGLRPILAGRNQEQIEALAKKYSLPFQVFSLTAEEIAAGLKDIFLVLHCAGPFSKTCRAMAKGCLRNGTHYLDITGEIEVLEHIYSLHDEAVKAGICLIPGVGFDVVPSDSLAVRLKENLPDANYLELAFYAEAHVSPGTMKSMLEAFPKGGMIRKEGKLVPVPHAYDFKEVPYSKGNRWSATIPWGDLSSAFRSTGIKNIRVYSGTPKLTARILRLTSPFHWAFGFQGPQTVLGKIIDRYVKGPSEEHRKHAKTYLWGKVSNPSGKEIEATTVVSEGYDFTVASSLECVKRILEGKAKPGSWTPAQWAGSDLVEDLGFKIHLGESRG